MELTVYGELRAATGTKTVELDADVETVDDAIAAFIEAYPRARSRLLDEDGDVRPSVRVTLDGERVDGDAACPDDAEIRLFPAMQGG
ncbi:ubiquitin-like small modifier protein 1 [Natronomonas amylolytica]|uniref:ubiquitin-like small modifier protein 1 n=1 Tax=Natronomonas amylolytica TaxID=3108498 RepID=UPI0030099FF3